MTWETILIILAASVVLSFLNRLRKVSPAWNHVVNCFLAVYVIAAGVYLAISDQISAWIVGATALVVGGIAIAHGATRGETHKKA